MKFLPARKALILASLVAALSGCSWFAGVNSKSAVQAAIEEHLKSRPGLSTANMNTEVQDVKFDGDKANARVVFVSKDSPDLKVEVGYTLRREGNKWVVESSTPMGGANGSPHGGMAAPPSTAMPPHPVPAAPSGTPAPKASH